MPDLTVTLIQTDLIWEDIPANLQIFDRLVGDLADETDLIVLPEMFTTGFSMNAATLAEDMDGSAVRWLRETASRKGADILGSFIAAESARYFNRLCWAKPSGALYTYDKKHLFRFAGEDKIYTAGSTLLTMEVNGWKIRPFICYDLRFPAWVRSRADGYDLAIFIANWPQKRSLHWKILLRARAIENQAYVIGVNRIGTDGNGLYHSGDSTVIDPLGAILYANAHAPGMVTLRLAYEPMAQYRRSFPAWCDADQITIR